MASLPKTILKQGTNSNKYLVLRAVIYGFKSFRCNKVPTHGGRCQFDPGSNWQRPSGTGKTQTEEDLEQRAWGKHQPMHRGQETGN